MFFFLRLLRQLVVKLRALRPIRSLIPELVPLTAKDQRPETYD